MHALLREPARRLYRLLVRSTVAVNVLFLMTSLRQCTVIHGDGPSGFGELAVKGLLAQFSILMFVFAATSAHVILKSKQVKLLPLCAFVLGTTIIALNFFLSVHDACSNDEGYCKEWSLDFSS